MFPYQGLLTALESDIECYGVSHDTPLTSDLSIEQVRVVALLRSFYKKLSPKSKPSKKAEANALAAFKLRNQRMLDEGDEFVYPVESELDATFWDYFRDNVDKATQTEAFQFTDFCDWFAPGPGAAVGANSANFYTKLFESKLTAYSPHQVALYRAAISLSPTWSAAEKARNDRYGVEIVSGNKIFFVTKTEEVGNELARTCATEANLAMLGQAAIRGYLERCLKNSFGLNLSVQQRFNRSLAYRGSLDGSFGTIDSTAASDSIRWSLCKKIFRGSLLGYLREFRADRAVLPDGSEIPLAMISTMGNGFTFPLQCLIFACAVRAVYTMMGLPSSCPRTQFGVFGDDVIVRREAYDFVIRSLSKLGFEVNEAKSFNVGMFRESCGGDFYNGHACRGVYVKSLETQASVYSAVNRLNRWSALTGVQLPETMCFLLGCLGDYHVVPYSESDDAGVKVPFFMTKPKLDDNYWFRYRKFVVKSKQMRVRVGTEVEGFADSVNESGLAVSFMGGYARNPERGIKSESISLDTGKYDALIGIRMPPDVPLRYKVSSASIPFWDYAPLSLVDDPFKGTSRYSFQCDVDESYRHWQVAVAANLGFET